jgi:hypothetical protein
MAVHALGALVWLAAAPAAPAPAPPVVIDGSNGPVELAGVDLAWFTQGAQTVSLTSGRAGLGNPQVDTRNCRNQLNLEILRDAAKDLLRRHRLSVARAGVDEGQLVVFTDPRFERDKASFYSFVAAMAPCWKTCSLRVAAWRITAPRDGRRLRMQASVRGNDDITGALLDVGEAEFRKCRR